MPSFLVSCVCDLWGFEPDAIFLSCVLHHHVVVIPIFPCASTDDFCFYPVAFLSSFSEADNISAARLPMLVEIWFTIGLIIIVFYVSIMHFLSLLLVVVHVYVVLLLLNFCLYILLLWLYVSLFNFFHLISFI